MSRTAVRLNIPQPTVSAAVTRLRSMTGDPLFVRGKNEMVPTERAEALRDAAETALRGIDQLCGNAVATDPNRTHRTFHIGALDYLGAEFLPMVLADALSRMPEASFHIHSLTIDFNYEAALERGELDAVVGNWAVPESSLRIHNLFTDDIVCLLRTGHPLVRNGLTTKSYVAADHVSLLPYAANHLGVIDAYLGQLGLRRHVRAVLPFFSSVPHLLLNSNLVFTTARRFAAQQARVLPLTVLDSPIDFPSMRFYLLWHERTHRSDECKAFRTHVAEAIERMWKKAEP